MQILTLKINDMDCASCSSSIEKKLKTIPIDDYTIDLIGKQIEIEYDETKINSEAILKSIKESGYKYEIIE